MLLTSSNSVRKHTNVQVVWCQDEFGLKPDVNRSRWTLGGLGVKQDSNALDSVQSQKFNFVHQTPSEPEVSWYLMGGNNSLSVYENK